MNLLKEMLNGVEAKRKYTIFGSNRNDGMEHKTTKSPAKAIEFWFKMQRKYNLNVSINAMTKDDAITLLDWASRNGDTIKSISNKYKSDYNIPFMVRKLENGYFHNQINKRTLDDNESISPFEVG